MLKTFNKVVPPINNNINLISVEKAGLEKANKDIKDKLTLEKLAQIIKDNGNFLTLFEIERKFSISA